MSKNSNEDSGYMEMKKSPKDEGSEKTPPAKATEKEEAIAGGSGGKDTGFPGEGVELDLPPPPCCSVRYMMVGLMCVGMILVNAMRTNVGFTVMTILDEQAHEKVGTLQALINLPNVKWDTRMIGFLHSIFYIGYLISHLPAGYLATRLPCHRLYGGSILLSCTLNLLLPVSIDEISYTFTCVIRFTQGLSEGLLYPACYGILRHWSTPQERGRVGSAVLTGAYAGAVIGFPVAGFITHFIGWQYIYYANGGAGVVWMLVWVLLSSEKPSHHRLISDTEIMYIEKAQGDAIVDFQESWLPWKRIITSAPVISLCLCHFARNWVFILMLTNEPFYLSLFGLNIAENGVYSSLPHVVKVLLSLVSGYIADFLLLKKTVTTAYVRKLLTGTAFGVQSVCFFILTFTEYKVPVIIFLTIGVGSGGLAVSGWQINHYDLSTRHASFLVAVTSTIGVLGAVAAPLVAGELTVSQDITGWNNVFYITVAIVATAAIIFLIFGSGMQQEWATPPEHIQLLQKTDPLARRPYKTFVVKGQQANKKTRTSGPEQKTTSGSGSEEEKNKMAASQDGAQESEEKPHDKST